MTKRSGTPKSVRFSDSEMELVKRVSDANGGFKPAIIKAFRVLDQQNETDWPAELRRLAAELEKH